MSMSDECFNESPQKEELALLQEGRNRQSPGLMVRKAVKDGWVCKDNTSKDPFSQCEQLQGITRNSHTGEK